MRSVNSLEDLILLVSKIPEIYESSNCQEKRKVLKLLYSNFLLEGKNPLFSIRNPLENILSRGFRQVWSGRRDCPSQTLSCLLTTYGAHRLIADRHTPVCLLLVAEHASPCSNRRPKTNKKVPPEKVALFYLVVYMARFKGKPRFRAPMVRICELPVRLVFLK